MSAPDYPQQIRQWRSQRIAQLLAPDGWLGVTGFGWLEPGANRIGSGAGNDIVFPGGPAHVGVVTLAADGAAWLTLAAGSNAEVDGERPCACEVRLFDDADPGRAPSVVRIGPTRLQLIHRDGRKGLRARDDTAAARVRFAGLGYFAIDPAWRVTADWLPFSTPCKLGMHRRLGTAGTVDVPGQARFSVHGRTHTLLPYRERPGAELLFVMADLTSGAQTCATARFLYAASPVDGKLVLDFNRAHNPPSAFTPYANCPVAPPENTLDLAVCAGEQRYRGHERA